MLLLVVENVIRKKETDLLKKMGIQLLNSPHIPNSYELKEIGRMFPPNFLHKSWNDFLYWDSELEP